MAGNAILPVFADIVNVMALFTGEPFGVMYIAGKRGYDVLMTGDAGRPRQFVSMGQRLYRRVTINARRGSVLRGFVGIVAFQTFFGLYRSLQGESKEKQGEQGRPEKQNLFFVTDH